MKRNERRIYKEDQKLKIFSFCLIEKEKEEFVSTIVMLAFRWIKYCEN